MCVVSAVTDFYRTEKWPINPWPPGVIPPPWTPRDDPQPIDTTYPWEVKITREQWDEYQKLKKIAEDYDKRNSEPHCEKPDLIDWEAKIVEVLIKRGLLIKGD